MGGPEAAGGQEDQVAHDAAVSTFPAFVGLWRRVTDGGWGLGNRTDYVLTQDKSFKKYAKAYAQDQDLWFKE